MSSVMVLILGCTACGKSRLAFELAKTIGGDILSIDSMKVYRRMDIGTAKPDPARRQEVTHHLIDVAEPWEPFSLGRFVELAEQVVKNLSASNRPIIAVGGTAMYIRGLIEGIFEGPPADKIFRERLKSHAQEYGLGSLHQRLTIVDPESASKIHPNDLKRLVRALEVYELTGKPISSFQTQFGSRKYRHPWKLFGIRRDKDDNNHRINHRVKLMAERGLDQEVKTLLADPRGISSQAAQAVGYAEIIHAIQEKTSLDEAFEQIKINTRRLAKSQRTWFRSFTDVSWLDCRPDQSFETMLDTILGHIVL